MPEGGGPARVERVGSSSGGMAESLQRCRFGRDTTPTAGANKQAATPSANSPSSSSSSSADRYKRKENTLSCLGPSRLALGSGSRGHHPVESWFRMGTGSEADYAKLSRNPAVGQGVFADGQADDPAGCSDSEDDETLTPTEEPEDPGSQEAPHHTNLFASALTRTSMRGGRGRKGGAPESAGFSRMERTLMKERSTSAERRETGESQLRRPCVFLSELFL